MNQNMTILLNVHDTWINVECNPIHNCKNVFYTCKLNRYLKDIETIFVINVSNIAYTYYIYIYYW